MCRFPKRNGMIKESYESDGRWVHCGHRNRERDRKTDIDLLFYLVMHSLVDSCMCPDGIEI